MSGLGGYWQAFNAAKGSIDDVFAARKRNALEQAMRGYAMNPDDPGAVNALAQADPAMAIQVRQQQATAQQAQQRAQQEKQQRDTAVIAALARDAKDPESFDAAVDQVIAMGYPDAAQFRGQFSPALRSALMAAGGIKEDTPEPTTFQRDAMAAGIQPGTPEFAAAFKSRQLRYVTDVNGNIRVVDPTAFIGDGGPQVANPAPGKGTGPPPVLTDDDWGDEGGPTPRASGGFL